ncbi:hypothetical protein QJS10_CPA08g01647 [Acorus calamus]|uniref:Uncharacterized protein n=1 Tax=Acorus calamus TaxID=4465 RepID=A0AAV9EBC0_ACOCL|nr:hypothetical protein QJS10_CPA08g01647 [Acorus calamus]
MGNCQASDAATAVVHHPGGRVERLYWPTLAWELMRSNPGHYVALVTLSAAASSAGEGGGGGGGGARVAARVKLLRPKDTLMLGHVYRLVTTQEVMKGLRARKQEKARRGAQEGDSDLVDPDKLNQTTQAPTTEDKSRLKNSQSVGGIGNGVHRCRAYRRVECEAMC